MDVHGAFRYVSVVVVVAVFFCYILVRRAHRLSVFDCQTPSVAMHCPPDECWQHVHQPTIGRAGRHNRRTPATATRHPSCEVPAPQLTAVPTETCRGPGRRVWPRLSHGPIQSRDQRELRNLKGGEMSQADTSPSGVGRSRLWVRWNGAHATAFLSPPRVIGAAPLPTCGISIH